MRKALSIIISILFVIISLSTINVFAEGALPSYTYNAFDEAVECVSPYYTDNVITGQDLGIDSLKNPKDMFVLNNIIYILDSGNNRILVLDESLKLLKTLNLVDKNKNTVVFGDAQGICCYNNNIYITDKVKKTVYLFDEKGVLIKELKCPDSSLLPDDYDYTPTKILVNSKGIVYVISSNTYNGAMQFDAKGNFIGFFGAEKVEVTPSLLIDLAWKKILSKEQQSGMKLYVPATFTNFDIDSSDFIYTVRQTGEEFAQVRCLNPAGNNILPEIKFGEKETTYDVDNDVTVSSSIADVCIDDDGYISIIDSNRGRIFQYDSLSNMLFAFGKKGNEKGAIQQPVAIESIGDNLLVLDEKAGSIILYTLTDFGRNVRTAISLYNDGKYMDCENYWKEILKVNSGYQFANIGMGKIYESRNEFKLAQKYYKYGNYKTGYSSAFKKQRDIFMNKYFAVTMLLLIAVIVIPMIVSVIISKHKKNEYNIHYSKYRFPLYCVSHPFKAYYELKCNNNASVGISFVILALWFIFKLLYIQFSGFVFIDSRPDQLNVIVEFAKTIGLFMVWILCNWAITTLMDGEGKFKEIWVFSSYALIPYVFALPILTILSNILVLEEGAFLSIAVSIVLIYTLINETMALKEVHQYSLFKTIFTALIAIGTIILVALLITIVYSMFSQLVTFVLTIINESKLK